jgi:hypothetical protein
MAHFPLFVKIIVALNRRRMIVCAALSVLPALPLGLWASTVPCVY